MMTRIIRNIPVFFILLAALALVAHMIIPHDHHLVESEAGQEDICPVSNNSTNHHTGFPVHCHAFIDLASERAVIHIILRNIQCRDFVTSCVFDSAVSDLQLSCLQIYDVLKLPINSYILELSSLRAPPILG